jgi:CubicO group peptidase (beta-lactamase class C family)
MLGHFKFASAIFALLAAVSAQGQSDSANLQGFNKEGLAAMNAAMHKWVDEKKGAGMVTLLARHGKIVNHDAYGVLDINAEQKTPVKKDTIWRIASMTKPVVGVAMMMFYEQGKWKLDDLLSKHIPEFADLKVKDASGNLVPPNKPITMAMVMSHSAGFPGQLSVPSATLGEIIPPLVKGQLAFQPGRDWRYGPGVEIQGYLVEKWAGKDLSDFMQERILGPLNMTDSGFFIDPSKTSRVSKVHSKGFGGTVSSQMSFVSTSKPKRLSPSGGLYSTAEDYFRFSQMLLNKGEYNGKRLLKPETVKIMHTNVLEPDVKVKMPGTTGAGIGFGMDFAVILDQAASNNNVPQDSYYWGGLYGTWFWIDPKNDVVFVGMIQNMGEQQQGPDSTRQISAKLSYAALSK